MSPSAHRRLHEHDGHEHWLRFHHAVSVQGHHRLKVHAPNDPLSPAFLLSQAAGTLRPQARATVQVLMALRRPQPATRIAAVEVVGALASALKEDYLAMLPEALPFLSELLEDLELPVRSATQQLLDQLEKQSGEKLDGYLK